VGPCEPHQASEVFHVSGMPPTGRPKVRPCVVGAESVPDVWAVDSLP
jgi:hypothetical protein